jgi:putative sterol carrier protein
MDDIQCYLQKIAGRFNEPRVQAALKDFSKTIQFTFSDIHRSWVLRVIDGKVASLSEGMVEKPDILVTTATHILAGVMDKKINPAGAYLQRKIQVRGAMEDLLRMQKLLL